MIGFRKSFVYKTEFCIVVQQFFFAGQNKSFSALRFCVCNAGFDQFTGIAMFAIIRNRIYTKNHLPCAVRVVQGSVMEHFVGQSFFICYKSIHKGNEFIFIKHQPEMVVIICQSFGKFFSGSRFCRRKTFCFHSSDRI